MRLYFLLSVAASSTYCKLPLPKGRLSPPSVPSGRVCFRERNPVNSIVASRTYILKCAVYALWCILSVTSVNMTLKLLVFLTLVKLTGQLYAVRSPWYTWSCMEVVAMKKEGISASWKFKRRFSGRSGCTLVTIPTQIFEPFVNYINVCTLVTIPTQIFEPFVNYINGCTLVTIPTQIFEPFVNYISGCTLVTISTEILESFVNYITGCTLVTIPTQIFEPFLIT